MQDYFLMHSHSCLQFSHLLFVYRLNEDVQTLTAEYTTLYYLDTAMRDKAKQFFKTEPKVFTWAKGRFE